MSVTLLGFALIPLCLAFCLKPLRLLQLMLLASIFEAAAALDFGSFGLQPSLVPSMLFLAFVLLQLLLGARYTGEREAWRAVLPFVLVTAWAVSGSMLLPRLFAGQIYVWPQKAEAPFLAVPLEPSGANLTQDIYIVADCAVLLLSALYLSQSKLNPCQVLNAYLVSGYAVVVVCAWQLANKLAGLPFPETFFYSNPGWAILSSQEVGRVPRISGPFSEPAALASYLSGIVCATGWMVLKGHPGRSVRALLVLALGAMLVSTSTTGFGVLGTLAVGVPVYAMLRGSRRLLGRVLLAGAVLAAIAGVGALATSSLLPDVGRAAEEVIAATLSKQESSSYQDRTSTDLDSLAVVLPTYGLGVGWGSNRSSSLIPGMLASLGVYGTLGLVWFAFGVARRACQARRLARDPADVRVIDGGAGAVVGSIAAALLSGPSIASVSFYVMLGLLIGSAARITTEARVRRRLPNALGCTSRLPDRPIFSALAERDLLYSQGIQTAQPRAERG